MAGGGRWESAGPLGDPEALGSCSLQTLRRGGHECLKFIDK